MTDFDRFVEWIRREAASYNEPPEVPAALIWGELETALKIENAARNSARENLSAEAGARGEGIAEDAVAGAGALYHDPPEVPRERMWRRIEASWLLRQSAPPAAREAGLSELEGTETLFDLEKDLDREEEPRRRSVALWLTGVAVAASILFGFMVGRGMPTPDSAAPRIATQPAQTDAPAVLVVDAPSAEDDEAAANDSEPIAPMLEPLETGVGFAAAGTPPPPSRIEPAERTEPGDERAEARPDRRQVVAQYATNAHLGRTETLLAAFGAGDAEPGQMSDVAQTARNLLGETRLLLDMSVTRSQRERALLEEIELLLAQIARLGPDAPAFERDIVAEGLERLGTVASLREIVPQIGT